MKARSWLFGLLAVAALVGCTTLTEELPQQPEAPVAIPPPIIIPPAQIPDVPHADPTPVPPPADPVPPPPPVGAQSCNLPPGNGPGTDCPRQSPSFLSDVES